MSREIKFRVYDTEKKELSYSFSIQDLASEMCYAVVEAQDRDELVWQQYTGLKDKNGVEIYEGDILEIEFQNIDNVIHMIKAEVVYDNNGFYENWDGFDVATVKTHQGLRPLTGSTTHEYNGKKFTMGSSGIIGNIFEGVDK